MYEFIPVLTEGEIAAKVARAARVISSDYRNRELILVGVLKGAFIFLSDLARRITAPVKIDFVEAVSYGAGTRSSGSVRLVKDIEIAIEDKDVLLVDDIVDTGLTAAFLRNHLQSFNPKTVKICTLLDKRERRSVNIRIDYACHKIQRGYLVGYGLDHAGEYRQWPQIYELKV